MAKGTLRKSVKRDVSSQSPPYTMEKLDARDAQRVGNDRYEGFVVDLIHAVAEIVGFNVRMYHCTLQSKLLSERLRESRASGILRNHPLLCTLVDVLFAFLLVTNCIGLHNSCSISPAASGTCQNCFTKHHD